MRGKGRWTRRRKKALRPPPLRAKEYVRRARASAVSRLQRLSPGRSIRVTHFTTSITVENTPYIVGVFSGLFPFLLPEKLLNQRFRQPLAA